MEEDIVMQEYDMCSKETEFATKDNLVEEFPEKVAENNRNRKTPQQNRTQAVRIKTRNDLSASAKKTFKESFNTASPGWTKGRPSTVEVLTSY